jgi:hypothetical protein
MDGLSVASLVLGILGIVGGVLLAIPFGIAGLVRTSRRRRRGRGMAVAGLAISAAWIAVAVVLIVIVAAQQPVRSADGTVVRQGSASPVDLRVGDCVKLGDLSSSPTVHKVTVTPCSMLHNAQVFGIVKSTDSAYPGQSTLEQEGLDSCRDRAPGYLGKPTSTLDIAVFVPSRILWDTGDRNERCLLVDRSENITGDIRNHS